MIGIEVGERVGFTHPTEVVSCDGFEVETYVRQFSDKSR